MRKFNFKKRKLRFDILSIFAGLFLLTTLGIIYYSYSRSSQAVLQMSYKLIEQTNQSVAESLDHFLRPESYIKVANYLLSNGLLDISDMVSLSSFTQLMLASYPQLTNAYLADTKGNMFIGSVVGSQSENQMIPFVNSWNIPRGTKYIASMITHSGKNTSLQIEYKNINNNLIKSEKKLFVQYDPRLRPWFIGAQKTSGIWIGLYQFFGTKKTGLTISFPLYVKNKIVGVGAADIKTELLSEALQKISKIHQGHVFIINSKNQIISDNKNEQGIVNISTIPDSIILATHNLYKKSGKTKFDFYYKNIKYIADISLYGLSETEKWQIVTLLPEELFIHDINNANKNILFFSMIMLALGLILIYFLSHKISRPIIRLASETKDIIRFKFNKTTIKTHIYEVQVMIDALNAMKATLSSFTKYVPRMLVEQLLKTQTIAQLGGQKQTITVLFTDVENFTTLSEKTDPELLMVHFSEYLNIMTQCIQNHHGNIDKYIGDAVMAFWGVPFIDEKHILHACEAVLDCREQITKMNRVWASADKPVLHTRFGLNTGVAVVGNMGSNDRLNYTAIGDTVNLAARLETLNKTYGTDIIVNESIYVIAKDDFLFRPVDRVRVRGKQQTTEIYELMAAKRGAKKFAPEDQQILLADLTWQGYECFFQQDFHKAKTIFISIQKTFPEDKLATLYISRCDQHLLKS